jgi:ACS family glucarate transporter-like MFS transporter
MALSKFVAAALYLLALQLKSPVALAVVFGLVAFWADLGLPAMWTTMQDISGKHQAQLFGWGNMWGNLGAAIMPLLFNKVLVVYDHNQDRHEGVWLCAAAFVLAGLCALAVDATKPVSREPGAAA